MANKVDNAIIMAAGLSSRFVPLSYEKPKALITVKGQILIERQIQQLHDKGIKDVIVVTGYQAEKFDYLKEKYQVTLIHNDQYLNRNNHYSLYVVKDYLKNSYICSADNYFSMNPFEEFVDESYYASVFDQGETAEWCMAVDADDYVQQVTIGGRDSWVMLGHVFFSESFSKTFVSILNEVIEKPETKDMLWEQILVDHLTELPIKIRRYEKSDIYEFDSLDELRGFDQNYINQSGSKILKEITNDLHCQERELSGFCPLKDDKNNTNGFRFSYRNHDYQYSYVKKCLEEN